MTTLIQEDYDEITGQPSPLFYPAKTGQKITKGKPYHLWVKVGGSMQLVSVRAISEPYPKGKASEYVDVFGYDFRGSVNTLKLLSYAKH